jgi:hypothetical protein
MPGLDPSFMTAAERLSEVAEILALGLVRLQTRQSTPLSIHCGESSVDFTPDQSGHAPILSNQQGIR